MVPLESNTRSGMCGGSFVLEALPDPVRDTTEVDPEDVLGMTTSVGDVMGEQEAALRAPARHECYTGRRRGVSVALGEEKRVSPTVMRLLRLAVT